MSKTADAYIATLDEIKSQWYKLCTPNNYGYKFIIIIIKNKSVSQLTSLKMIIKSGCGRHCHSHG